MSIKTLPIIAVAAAFALAALLLFGGGQMFQPSTAQAQSPPGTPSSVSVTRADGSLTASWDAVSGATSYHITYTSNNGASWSLAALNHPSNSITISSIDNSKTYIVGVRARNEHGDSIWRNSAPSGPFTPSAPATPSSVSVARADGTLAASWDAVSGATSYHITYTSNNGTSWSLGALNHPDSSITISDVDNAKTYIVGVRARNSAGDSWWRNSAPAGPFQPPAPVPTATYTPTPTATYTPTPTATSTATPTATATATATPTPTPTPTSIPTPIATITPTPTTIPTPIPTPTDREALVALYNATDGANWTENSNWLSDKPLDDWHGIYTDGDGRVRLIYLAENNLNGTIPSELGSMDRVTAMSLGENRLSGELPPELGNMSSLKYLHIYETDISGAVPPEFGNLSNLLSLVIFTNELTGALPSELTNLKKLYSLHFSENDGLCAPNNSAFQAWFAQIRANADNHRRGLWTWYTGHHGPNCDEGIN